MQALMMPALRKLIFSGARFDSTYDGATKFAMTLTAIVTITRPGRPATGTGCSGSPRRCPWGCR